MGSAFRAHLESDIVHRVGREVASRHHTAMAAARVAAQHVDLLRGAVDLVGVGVGVWGLSCGFGVWVLVGAVFAVLRLGSALGLGFRCIYRVKALGECVDGRLQPCAPHLRRLRFRQVRLRRGRPVHEHVHVQGIGS